VSKSSHSDESGRSAGRQEEGAARSIAWTIRGGFQVEPSEKYWVFTVPVGRVRELSLSRSKALEK